MLNPKSLFNPPFFLTPSNYESDSILSPVKEYRNNAHFSTNIHRYISDIGQSSNYVWLTWSTILWHSRCVLTSP